MKTGPHTTLLTLSAFTRISIIPSMYSNIFAAFARGNRLKSMSGTFIVFE